MPRPRRYDAALRRHLLDVSSEAISRSGPDGISLRRVAADAGTTTAAVYALFGGREQLIDAVAAEGFTRFGTHLDAVTRTSDARADLLALGLAYRTSALADPHFYQVMFGLHLILGFLLVVPMVVFGCVHIVNARNRPNRRAVRVGYALFAASIAVLITGIALPRIDLFQFKNIG